MMGAGHYEDRLVWMRQRDRKDGDAGAVGDDFQDSGTLWCAKEQPSGAEKIHWSALQSTVVYRVRLRGCPGVRMVDRFRDPESGTVYLINGVHEEEHDQVCAVMELVS